MKVMFFIALAAAISVTVVFVVISAVRKQKNYIVKALLCALIAGIAAVGYCTTEMRASDSVPSAVHITRSPAESVDMTVVSPAPSSPQAASQCVYTASSKSEKFHLPSCSAAGRISDDNRLWFSSRDEAVAEGYSPCGICKP